MDDYIYQQKQGNSIITIIVKFTLNLYGYYTTFTDYATGVFP